LRFDFSAPDGGLDVIHASDVDETEPVRMAQIAKKTKRYPSNLRDEEWEDIAPPPIMSLRIRYENPVLLRAL
jgi:hypothetical protein